MKVTIVSKNLVYNIIYIHTHYILIAKLLSLTKPVTFLDHFSTGSSYPMVGSIHVALIVSMYAGIIFSPTNFMAGQPTPPKATPPRNKGLIAGLIKGNQWLISP